MICLLPIIGAMDALGATSGDVAIEIRLFPTSSLLVLSSSLEPLGLDESLSLSEEDDDELDLLESESELLESELLLLPSSES